MRTGRDTVSRLFSHDFVFALYGLWSCYEYVGLKRDEVKRSSSISRFHRPHACVPRLARMTAPRTAPTGSARPRRRIGRMPASAPSERLCVLCRRVRALQKGGNGVLTRGQRLRGRAEVAYGMVVCARAVRSWRDRERPVGRSARRVSVVARGVGGHGLATSHINHESRRRACRSVFRMRECTSFSASLHFP